MIYAHGAIRSGRSGRGGPGGGGMGSDTVAAALRAAGKPVVVSMGDVAASGGYFISAPADVIVAQPATITGSIGVILGKPVLQELFERVGVSTDLVADGAANATMFSSSRPFSDTDWSRINEWLDAIYADFTEKVASGRRMDIGRVHELARGRVWTGADAVANGLADQTGGMREAIAVARRRAGLPDDAPVRSYPRFGPLDQLRPAESSESRPAAAGSLGAGAVASVASVASLFADGWGPAWRFAAAAGLPPHGPLALPGVWKIS